MHGKYRNKFKQDDQDERMWSIYTEPKFAIGQRCILLELAEPGPLGRRNVLWDCITYVDDETVEFIKSKGGLEAIVISHPHYYTTHLDWAEAFDCPVIVADEDREWLNRKDNNGRRRSPGKPIWPSLAIYEDLAANTVIARPGGHFPGSLVLQWEQKLMIADTFVTTPVSIRYERTLGVTQLTYHSLHITTRIANLGQRAMHSCGRSPT